MTVATCSDPGLWPIAWSVLIICITVYLLAKLRLNTKGRSDPPREDYQ